MPSIYDRPPTPGQMIQVLILEPYRMTPAQLAKRLRVMWQVVDVIIKGALPLDVDLALRLATLTGTSPNYWLDAQRDVDLYDRRKAIAKSLEKIEPFPAPLRLRKLVLPTADDIENIRP